MSESSHIAVMTAECMDALDIHPGGRYLDGTLGGGTHTAELLRLSAPKGKVISLDVDPAALERFRERSFGNLRMTRSDVDPTKRWKGVEADFRNLADVAREEKMAPLDGILIDLGFSSDQMSDPKRGLSFQTEGPLDMRLGPSADTTAAHIVNGWRERELADLIREYGEERYARPIAQAIVTARKSEKIITTSQLADIIAAAVPASYERGRIHPATRTFQALRIAVNDELNALREAIDSAHQVLAPGGRLAIISFHSLEDRIVKAAFKDAERWKPLFKKPLVPSDAEVKENPRSRSAKLRVAIKV